MKMFRRPINILRFHWFFVGILIFFIFYQFLITSMYIIRYNLLENISLNWQDIVFRENQNGTERLFPKKEISILRYTKYFGHFENSWLRNANSCPNLEKTPKSKLFNVPCRITFDRNYLNVSDALVFHSPDLSIKEFPEGPRNVNQLWIFMNQESPMKTVSNLHEYPNIFNWTMTYRQDSDVYIPYNQLVPISNNQFEKSDFFSKLTKKTGQIAWIVSNCQPPSKREYFVEELKKYINIDTFGWCGRKCPPKHKQNCYEYVSKTHKFFLSFENSLCSEYVTEKFFTGLKFNMLPVVYGGIDGQDYSSIAPNYSYIDARHFNSPKDLANYLIYLDQNDKEYMKYFEWKDKYSLVSEDDHWYWCNLCQRVYEHLRKDPPDKKWYKDLWKWWNFVGNNTPACLEPPKKFTDFDHGYFKVGISGLWANWFRKHFYDW